MPAARLPGWSISGSRPGISAGEPAAAEAAMVEHLELARQRRLPAFDG